MKTIRAELSDKLQSMELHPLADWHIGDAMSDWKLIQKTIKHIQETPNAYCILGGDLMDTAVAASIGDTYAANLQPMQQLEACAKIFEPIKDKILCIVHGNHENRVYKSDGIDMTAIMAAQLGLADKYSPTTALLFLSFGKNKDYAQSTNHARKICYAVYVTHGSGGGRKEGGKINRLADYATIVDADVYICGHTHLPASFKTGFVRTNYKARTTENVTKLFVNTASALDYGGYGDVQGYKPGSKDNPVIYLSGRERKINAFV